MQGSECEYFLCKTNPERCPHPRQPTNQHKCEKGLAQSNPPGQKMKLAKDGATEDGGKKFEHDQFDLPSTWVEQNIYKDWSVSVQSVHLINTVIGIMSFSNWYKSLA